MILMCKKLAFITSFILVLVLAGANTAFGVISVDVRVAASNDDAEEEVSSGGMSRGSSDLELGHEGVASATSLQIIGVRFTGVEVPPGSAITNAYVQFSVDDKDNEYHNPPVSLVVTGELSPDAVGFGDEDNPNISARPATAASEIWDILQWGRNQGAGPAERTPNISHVIQEIIEQDGWAAGNAIVIILADNPDNPSEGTREAEAFDGDVAYAPLLHIEYIPNTASDPNPADGGVSGRAPLLQWTEGASAATYDVYLGTTADLGPADLVDSVPYAAYWHAAGLTPGTTYYWRVDAVEADGTTIHTGDVWSFTAVDVAAHSPNPTAGDKMALPDVVLSWGSGLTAVSHDVYFGTKLADVVAGTGGTFMGNQSRQVYNPVALQNDTTYYWRVDEVEADGTTKHPGEIWSFKTREDPTLIGWWKFDEGQGIIAYDSSGYGNHGIIGHDNGDDGALWTAGVIGGGLELDGDDDYVSISSIVPMMTSYNWTFSMWIKTDGEVLSDDHILLGSNTDSSHEFLFGIMNGNLWQDAGTEAEYPPKIADKQWHMVTYVSDSLKSRIYVDGVLRKEDEADDDMAEETRWSIGMEWDSSPSDEYAGLIDDARFWIRPLTAEEIAEVFKGDVELAHSPQPISGTVPDVEHVPPISWSPGEDAVQHDVYFGTDELAVGAADTSDATIYRGRQNTTSYTPPEDLAWGTGPYYWRIDEVKADGTVSEGMVWTFSVGDFLNVDDFESYNNIDPPDPESNTIFGSWVDGYATPMTNGALVGNDIPPYCETRAAYVHSGAQAMPYLYGNNDKSSVATLALTGAARDFTRQGVERLSLWFRGESTNAVEPMYVALNGIAISHDNTNATQVDAYEEWIIPLQEFADLGVTLTNVNSIAIGFGIAGGGSGRGMMYFDDIRLYKAAP